MDDVFVDNQPVAVVVDNKGKVKLKVYNFGAYLLNLFVKHFSDNKALMRFVAIEFICFLANQLERRCPARFEQVTIVTPASSKNPKWRRFSPSSMTTPGNEHSRPVPRFDQFDRGSSKAHQGWPLLSDRDQASPASSSIW